MKRRHPGRAVLLAALGAGTGADRIGPRVVMGTANGNRESLFYLDPADYGCARLARELADEWVEYVDAAQLRSGRALVLQRAVHQFCTVIDAALGDGAGRVSLADGRVKGLLIDWERSLPQRFRTGSNHPANMANALHLLIARRDEHPERAVDPALARFVSGPVLVAPGRSSELDEFTRAEKRAMVRAAWDAVHALEARLAAGRALAEQGRHPDQGDWQNPADLLWGLWHGAVSPAQITAALPRVHRLPDQLRHLAAAAGSPRRRMQDKRHLLGALTGMLFPTTLDLHAFRVLLVDATGYTSEEVCGFGESDVEFVPGGVRLTLVKHRAGLRRHRFFRNAFASESVVSDVSVDRSRREAGAIVQKLLEVTAETRRRAEHVSDSLFVAARLTADQRLVFDYWRPSMYKATFASWLASVGVAVAGERHIGRLRKSTKVEKAIVAQGRISVAANDHLEETFAGHYAQGTTLRILSGEVITRAQEHWFDKALTGPTLIGDPAQGEGEQLQALGLSAAEAEGIVSGQLDMGVSACKDPWASPFSPAGELCAVAPLRCLECANAWILPSHLPQLLLFEAHLERARQRLDPVTFTRVWSQTYTNLKAVLADRSESELASARAHIAAGRAELHLPLAADTEFDR